MGDILELLEQVKSGIQPDRQTKGTNLYDFLLNKEYLTETDSGQGETVVALTEKGEKYLNAIYLLRIEQTPHNFLDRDESSSIIARLEKEGYVSTHIDGDKAPLTSLTDKGQELLEILKEQD